MMTNGRLPAYRHPNGSESPVSPLTSLIARRFIARPDAVAIQQPDGSWRPLRRKIAGAEHQDWPLTPWSKDLLEKQVDGGSYGHYLVNRNNQCKLFAFDVDLRNTGTWVDRPGEEQLEKILDAFPDDRARQDQEYEKLSNRFLECNPRELWQNKKHLSRQYFLDQMYVLVSMLASRIHKELDIPVAAAYSGYKGFHVYGFTGIIEASTAAELGLAVLESFNAFTPTKGNNYFVHNDTDLANFSIELYPKQSEIRDDGFGNLMALPLGVNLKAPKSRRFFLDLRAAKFKALDVESVPALLDEGNPWI
jgi:hypothetical protein